MENGYLGGAMLAGTFLAMSLTYWQFRRQGMAEILDSETAATIAGLLLTASLAWAIVIFASNAYLTGTYSTAVSSLVAASAFMALVLTIARTRTNPAIGGSAAAEPFTPAPFTPETPPANTNKPTPHRGKSRRKAA